MASSEVRRVTRDLESFTARRSVDLAARLVRKLAGPPPVGTPRDTHWHSANWILTAGRPATGVNGTYQEARAGLVRRAEQRAAIARVRAGYKAPNRDLNVTNNARAIRILNNGHSRQSPSGFVQKAIAASVSEESKRR